MSLNRKGQVSFELLLITAIVFIMAIWISSYYLAIKDGTLAAQISKVHTIKQIEEVDESFVISRLDFEELAEDEITIALDTKPNTFECDSGNLDSDELKKKIQDQTGYTKVNVNLNGNSC